MFFKRIFNFCSLICIFCFCFVLFLWFYCFLCLMCLVFFLCFFCFLVRVKSFRKKSKKFKTGTSHSASLPVWFLKENISLFIFYYLTTFYSLLTFTSWDVGHYAYLNCLLTKFEVINFEIKAAICWYLVHCQTCAYSYSTLILAHAS